MSSIDKGDLENIICATEPNEGHDLGAFELPDDDDDLLTVNLSPSNMKSGRRKSKSFKMAKPSGNATAPAKVTGVATATGRVSLVAK